jgi:PadR family transcriptional regulator, regulatory protein PadR
MPRQSEQTDRSRARPDHLHGTLDALVLKTLSWGPRHGYAIARWLEQATEDALRIEEGSLYPALYRLEKRDWIEAEWGMSELGRRAKFYRLTPRGRAELQREAAEWLRFAGAVSRVLLAEA